MSERAWLAVDWVPRAAELDQLSLGSVMGRWLAVTLACRMAQQSVLTWAR